MCRFACRIYNFLREASVKMTKNGKNGHFGDPEKSRKNESYQKRTDIMMCLNQTYQENILDV